MARKKRVDKPLPEKSVTEPSTAIKGVTLNATAMARLATRRHVAPGGYAVSAV